MRRRSLLLAAAGAPLAPLARLAPVAAAPSALALPVSVGCAIGSAIGPSLSRKVTWRPITVELVMAPDDSTCLVR